MRNTTVLVITLPLRIGAKGGSNDRPIDALLVGLGIRPKGGLRVFPIVAFVLIAGQGASAQSKDPAINQDESKVPVYTTSRLYGWPMERGV